MTATKPSHDEATLPDLEKGGRNTFVDDEKTSIEDIEVERPEELSIDKEIPEPIAKLKSRSSSVGRASLGKIRSRASSRKSRRDTNLVKEIYPETDLDKGLVGWEGQDDPLHPRNIPDARKWLQLALVSSITLLSSLSSSMNAPGISIMNAEFHNTSDILSTLAVSIFIFGFAVGPLVLSPLSEIYGRLIVLNISNAFMTAWQLAAALSPNLSSLIVFRFLAGVGGSACLAVGGGVIADLFAIQRRGLANSMLAIGPLFGPTIGPVMGGFVAQRAGWRWVFWVLLIACGCLSGGFVLVSKETNALVLIRAKTKKMIKQTGRKDLRSAYDEGKSLDELKVTSVLATGIARPFRMMTSSPILPLLAIYLSFLFSLAYLIFTTVPALFIRQYEWTPELTGLAYIGVGVGFFLGMMLNATYSDPTVIRLTAQNKGVYQPEMRLASCVFFGLIVPVSFFWYGWSAEKKSHWIVPILGLLPFGVGVMGILTAIQTYFIDAAGIYAASAMAGLTFLRCSFGTFMPLAGPKMYASLGLGWGNSLLGFLALGLIPVPLMFFKYGARIRQRYPIKLT